jgi:hypothetical protein
MPFITYRLKQRRRAVGKGATEARYGDLEAIIKQDHNEARGQVYSEIVAYRLAMMVGVEVATGVLVADDTGLKFASLAISKLANRLRDISTEADVKRLCSRYAQQSARLAVFDLWIGNDDRLGNVRADVTVSSDRLVVGLDHGRALLGSASHLGVSAAFDYLSQQDKPRTHPFSGLLHQQFCDEALDRINCLHDDAIQEACVLSDTCGMIMVDDQLILADLLKQRRAFLPNLVQTVLQPIPPPTTGSVPPK